MVQIHSSAQRYMQTRRNYSRLSRIEDSRHNKTATKFAVLTIGLILALVFLGIPLVTRLAGFVTNIEEEPKAININDQTPPAPPKLNNVVEFSKENEVKIEGNTEAGATLKLFVNEESRELVADASGSFSTKITLKKGDNQIYATSRDTVGNESQKSRTYTIVFDNEAPKVEITKPQNGQNFFGSKQKQIAVEGITDPEAQVTINDRVVVVSSDGKFIYSTELGDGSNNFNIKSTDKAGNQTETNVEVNYSP